MPTDEKTNGAGLIKTERMRQGFFIRLDEGNAKKSTNSIREGIFKELA